jgi:hypothetical protein
MSMEKSVNSKNNLTRKEKIMLAGAGLIAMLSGGALIASADGMPGCDPNINDCTPNPSNPDVPITDPIKVGTTTTVPETTIPSTTVPETTIPSTTTTIPSTTTTVPVPQESIPGHTN